MFVIIEYDVVFSTEKTGYAIETGCHYGRSKINLCIGSVNKISQKTKLFIRFNREDVLEIINEDVDADEEISEERSERGSENRWN